MSSYGFQVTNNANQQLIDEFSKQIQIVKTVTGLVPGGLTPFSDMPITTWSNIQRTGCRFREPAMGSMERCPGVVLPGGGYSEQGNIGTDDVLVFARANDPLGQGGAVSFNVLRGRCWIEWEAQTSTSGLNSYQVLMKYVGPWEEDSNPNSFYGRPGNYTSYLNANDDGFGIPFEWNHGLIWQYQSNNYARNPYPNDDPYLWRDNAGGHNVGAYELEVVGHEPTDLIDWELWLGEDFAKRFGKTKTVQTTVNTDNGSVYSTLTLNNTSGLEVGMRPVMLSTAWTSANNFDPAIVPFAFTASEITSISGNNVTIKSQLTTSLYEVPSGTQIRFCPKGVKVTDVTPSGSNYKVTFNYPIEVRPSSPEDWYPQMNTLFFARHIEKSWYPSNNRRGLSNQYYGYHPQSQGNYSGTQITLKSGGSPTSDIAVGDRLFVYTSTGNPRSGQQGTRTLTAINHSTRQLTFNGSVSVSTNDYIIIRKNTGYTLDVKIGQLTNFEEEIGTHGLQVYDANGDLAWSSNRENFVIENIASASNLKPGVHSILYDPGTPARSTGFLHLEGSDTSNWEDYWVQVTAFDACALYTEGGNAPYFNGSWGLAYHWNFPGGGNSYLNASNYGTQNTIYNYSSTSKSSTSKLGVGIGAQCIQMFNRMTTVARTGGGTIGVSDAYIMGGPTSLILGKFI